MIDIWISLNVLENLKDLKRSFVGAKPYPHITLKGFLLEEKAEALARELRKEKFFEKDADLFHFFQTNDLTGSKNKVIREFAEFVESKEFANFMKSLTGLNVKAGALDLAGSCYKSGDYLLCHDDQVEDRKIAYVLYLAKGFTEKDGARFVLFDNKAGKPTKEVQKIVPAWNSLMLFEVSPISFHMVEENLSAKDRYAIGGWLH